MSNGLNPDQARDFSGTNLVQAVCRTYQHMALVGEVLGKVNLVSLYM